ncbi:pyocin activator PrtN family protein [Ferrimonas balearica]|uniref:pyocin activator PrtN family protein n=1 Tax=Ferrimonas balearica TaxID=44012 RepID=UPI001C563701|nr:pyocin activator PrtN family protein [Ferrimonas balearica]
MLMYQFGGRAYVPLSEICEEMFGLSEATARRKAQSDSLPVPVARLDDSQKSPWFVSVSDLAMHVNQCFENARSEWLKQQ